MFLVSVVNITLYRNWLFLAVFLGFDVYFVYQFGLAATCVLELKEHYFKPRSLKSLLALKQRRKLKSS